MKYLLGVDIGTSGTKAVLFGENGEIIESAVEEYPMYQPRNGWAEQRPEDWWKASCEAIQYVVKNSGISPEDIAGVGLSGQMHGLVMLDDEGKVLRRSIIWCDGRTTEECEEITEIIGRENLIKISANPALPGFTASKIIWVRKNEPDIYEKCKHILLPKDYIRYMLTGEYATEVSDASGMNLMDVAKRDWSSEILEKLEINKSLLPKMYESYEITGVINKTAAKLTGLCEGALVSGGAGDNAAAAIGMGVVKNGKAFTTIGTSGVIFAHSDNVSIDQQGRVHTFCSAVPGAWTVMSCTLAAGGSLQWFRNQFCASEIESALGMGVDPYYIMDRQAARSPIGANRLIFLPYLMGERSPLLDSCARGVFFGLSAIHHKSDMIRAVMEGVSYSLRSCLDIISGMGIKFDEMLACGGGGSSTLWRQMLADIYNCPVNTLSSKAAASAGGALGVAILAGVGAGLYKSVGEACDNMIKTDVPVMPDKKRNAEYEKYYKVFYSLYPALKEQFRELAKL
ncbi:MAG: xylulokinase [Eubacterium sp.]|jgi:xylulokinase|nr:xylulokinase [Eubacterium sp.]